MKKILPALVLISFLTVLVMPMVTSAQEVFDTCTLKRDFDFDDACDKGEEVNMEEHGMCCLMNTLYNITDWIFVVLVAIAALFVVIGAVTLLTSAGDLEKTKKGRDYIMWAAIGLAVGFLAKAVPGIVKLMIGVG